MILVHIIRTPEIISQKSIPLKKSSIYLSTALLKIFSGCRVGLGPGLC